MNILASEKFTQDGFVKSKLLDSVDIEYLQKIIKDVVNTSCELNLPKTLSWNEFLKIYSTTSDNVHLKISDKKKRSLRKNEVETLFGQGLRSRVHSLIGEFDVSDEENYGYPEVYWRIVRPNAEFDVGPLHADGWFWDCNPLWKRPVYDHKRIKIWIGIEVSTGKNGLLVIPKSHNNKPATHKVISSGEGKFKPVIDPLPKGLLSSAQLVNVLPGEGIVFDDKLLHGGAKNVDDLPRISIEFTCIKKS
jgi:hypothetical protein